MIQKIDAIYDGDVLRPAVPLNLAPNTKVSISLDVPTPEGEGTTSFLDAAESLKLDGPADWSAKVESYLYQNENLKDG